MTPRGVDYHGYTLYELPPNGQGFAALIMLNILKQVDLREFERGGPEIFHYMVEAKRLAFEAMAGIFADPDFAEMPIDELLSESFAKRLFERIKTDSVITPERLAVPLEGEGDTTYLTVVDGNGMMVSLIQSNYRGMGSGLVPTGLGFMLQDRGELFFDGARASERLCARQAAIPYDHPRFFDAGRRAIHELWSDGGRYAPQGHVQVLVNMADFGMNVQEAGDAARFLHDGGSSPDEGVSDRYGTLFCGAWRCAKYG